MGSHAGISRRERHCLRGGGTSLVAATQSGRSGVPGLHGRPSDCGGPRCHRAGCGALGCVWTQLERPIAVEGPRRTSRSPGSSGRPSGRVMSIIRQMQARQVGTCKWYPRTRGRVTGLRRHWRRRIRAARCGVLSAGARRRRARPDVSARGARQRGDAVARFPGRPLRWSLALHRTRGHPRLRMRHAPFTITPAARDRWLQLMTRALDEVQLTPSADGLLRAFFAEVSTMMRSIGRDPDRTGRRRQALGAGTVPPQVSG